MKRTVVTLLAVVGLLALCQSGRAQTAVGHWRDCFDYSKILHIQPAGDRIFAAARNGLFCYDVADNMLKRMSKVNGLSDAGVSNIAYDARSNCLVVVYSNANVDLVYDNQVYNLSDIKRSDISGDRSVYNVRFHAGKAYLATGFGIVVVDLSRHEIKETCYIGTGGTYTAVRDMAFTADSIFAATDEGLKRIAIGEQHLTVSDRWQTDHRLDSVTVTMLEVLNGRLLVAGYASDPEQLTLYVATDTGYRAWNRGLFHSMRVGGSRVVLTREGSVVRYDTTLQPVDSLTHYTWGSLLCYDAVATDANTLWVGHEWDGLICIRPDGDNSYFPPGPFSADNTFRLVPFNYRMMLCPGGHTSVYGGSYLPANMLTAVGTQWSVLDKGGVLPETVTDLVDVAVNPSDTHEVVAAFWGAGVASIRDNKVATLYDESNTGGALTPYIDGSGHNHLIAGAVAFDANGNLWVLNSHSSSALATRSSDGTWRKYNTSQLADVPELDKLIWDSVNNYLWFCGRSNVIYVHDGQSRMARVNPNSGSKLSTDAVTALVQDRSGNLWVGTNKGIKVIYDAYNAFKNGGNGELAPVTCSNITITNGEFYEYLMAYESITAIAVDGANRKWVGTAAGGLYLISANGLEQLQHFTAENSPLFSNKIITLGIQPRTGEVYVGTDRGLQVYRSTATYAEGAPLEQVYAFPNPVRPDYDGTIAIKGFTRDALVHITDAAGHTVFSTRALGGQAVWNGRTVNGEPVAAGVYYVFAADSEGGNRSVTKILIIR